MIGQEPQDPQRRSRSGVSAFVRDSLSNATGTLVAALVIFVGARIAGALDDISTGTFVVISLFTLSALMGIYGFSLLFVAMGRIREDRYVDGELDALRAESEQIHRDYDDFVQETDGLHFKLVAARAANNAGEVEEAERLLGELEIEVERAVERREHFLTSTESRFQRAEQRLHRLREEHLPGAPDPGDEPTEGVPD